MAGEERSPIVDRASTAADRVTVLELMGQASGSTPGPAPPPPPRGGEDLMERVERLTAELENHPDPVGRALAEDLVGAVLELHGEGLAQVLSIVDDDTAHGLSEDGVVASLMLIHDLYPVPLDERVMEALDNVRPYMESHGGNVELLGVEDGVARLRLDGSCSGCSASSATLELAIKKELMETAPDLLGLEVEGIDEDATHGPPDIGGTPLPLAGSGGGGGREGFGIRAESFPGNVPALSGWQDLDGVAALDEGHTSAESVGGLELFVANVNGTLLAYRNACAACSSQLDGGPLTDGVMGCPACQVSYDLPKAGRAIDGSDLQLSPVPLLRDGPTHVRVALPS